jgi:chromosome segregation ATPase
MIQTDEDRERLLSEARTAHRDADRERSRARRLAGRIARKLNHTYAAARAQFDADRAKLDARIAAFNAVQSAFNAASAADRDRQRAAWADLDARQKRLSAEWEESARFHTAQSAALDARAAELSARERTSADETAKLQRELSALREEIAALDARARNARESVDELEQRRAELLDQTLAPTTGAEAPPAELQVALDRAADRDLALLAAELADRERRLNFERAAVQGLCVGVSAEKADLVDRRRVLAEQFAQLALARVRWQEAERVTLVEMEQLARSLRYREAELDARAARLTAADARRRTDGYDLWQFRLRLEAWQSKLVAYEMRWHTEREQLEADFNRRLADVAHREALLALPVEGAEAVPFALVVPEESNGMAVSAEVTSLRDELERMAAVLLEAELPEPPDPPDSELPWGAEEVFALPDDSDVVLLFEPHARAA